MFFGLAEGQVGINEQHHLQAEITNGYPANCCLKEPEKALLPQMIGSKMKTDEINKCKFSDSV